MVGLIDFSAEFSGGTRLGSGSTGNTPIGIFDSEFGGLTVAHAVMNKFLDERILYLGSTAYTPCGPELIVGVRRYILICLDEPTPRGVKALTTTCSTTAVAVLSDTRGRYWIDAYILVIEITALVAR